MSKASIGSIRVLVTHNDLDGVGCSIVYNKCFPGVLNNFTNYSDVNHVVQSIIENNRDNLPIMLSDLSISNDDLCEALDKRGNFEMIDHHPTAKWMSEKYEWALVDTTKSATQLMFEVMKTRFNIDDLEPFVTLVNNYDTWGGGAGPSPAAIKLNRLLGVYGVDRFFNRFMINHSTKLTETEELLLELKDEEIERYMAAVVDSVTISKDPQGNKYAMIAIDRFISESCNKVLKAYPDAEYVMAVDFINSKVSLRGRGNVNLGQMAKAIGGGGHKQSAGFSIQHGSHLRMILACQGKCPVTDRLESIISNFGKEPGLGS